MLPRQSPGRQAERRRQIRGLLLLAALVLALLIHRAGPATIFTRGWWRF